MEDEQGQTKEKEVTRKLISQVQRAQKKEKDLNKKGNQNKDC